MSKMLIRVDLGDRVKIDKINVIGNEVFSSKKLRKKNEKYQNKIIW